MAQTKLTGGQDEKNMSSNHPKGDRSFRYKEHEGFGHYQANYSNFLKRQKKSITTTLSNDGSTISSDSEECWVLCPKTRR